MQKIFKIDDKPDLVEIRCIRFKNYNDFRSLAKKISKECKNKCSNNLLIINASSEHLYPLLCLLIIECLKNAGIEKHHKIALVDPLKNNADEDEKLFEVIACNKGLDNLSMFDELAKAREWLSL